MLTFVFFNILWILLELVPILLLILLALGIYLYVSAKRANKKAPDTFSHEIMKRRRAFLIASCALFLFFVALMIGIIAVVSNSIAFM